MTLAKVIFFPIDIKNQQLNSQTKSLGYTCDCDVTKMKKLQ